MLFWWTAREIGELKKVALDWSVSHFYAIPLDTDQLFSMNSGNNSRLIIEIFRVYPAICITENDTDLASLSRMFIKKCSF